MSHKSQLNLLQTLPATRVTSFFQLPCPTSQRLSHVLSLTSSLRSSLSQLSSLSSELQTLKQSTTAQLVSLTMSFQLAKNDLKYRCDNLQATIVNMQQLKQIDNARYAELLTSKQSQIAELTKRLEQSERQQRLREKVEMLMERRGEDEDGEVEVLNRRITELLGVIQAGNREVTELRVRVKHAQEQPRERENQEVVRSLQLKNALIAKELEEYKLENCQLAQEIREIKFGQASKRQRSNSKNKHIPKLDLSMNQDKPKPLSKSSYLTKYTTKPKKPKQPTSQSNQQSSSSSFHQPIKQHSHSRVPSLTHSQLNSIFSKVKLRRWIDNMQNDENLRVSESERTTERVMTDRDMVNYKKKGNVVVVVEGRATLRKWLD